MKKNILNNNLVVQHNNLIEAQYTVNLQEKRLILWLMSQIKRDDKDFSRYSINIKEFSKTLGINNNHNLYSEMKKITASLLKKVISIHIPEKKQLIQTSFFSSAIYKLGEGTVEFTFDPALKPFLLELNQQFTALSLGYALKLSSAYAIRLYELLKQYNLIGKRTITLKNLRNYLGIEAEKYKLYSSFKTKILLYAQKEINLKTDIFFDFKEFKDGKRINSIEFILKKNPNHIILDQESSFLKDNDKNIDSKNVEDILIKKYQLAPQQVNGILNTRKLEDIKQILNYVDECSINKKITNLAAYTYKALQENWGFQQLKIQNDNESKVSNFLNNVESETWRKVLKIIYNKLGKDIIYSWFFDLDFVKINYDTGTVILETTTRTKQEYITQRYMLDILKSFQEEYNFIEFIEINLKKN